MSDDYACDRVLLVQADFDGELDAGQAAALISHRAECAHCRAAHEQLVISRNLLRSAPRFGMRQETRMRLQEHLRLSGGPATKVSRQTRAGSGRTERSRWLAIGATVGAVAVLAGVTLRPPSQDVSSQLVSNHVRALQIDSHLIDVASSDHHTVKPWFAGKVNFAPLVKELGSYPLKGGRVDVVRGSPVAVLVYGAGRHVVDVYMWPESAGGAGGLADRRFDGFNLRHWNEGGLVVWCVSDMGAPELDRFVELWRREQ